MSSRRVRRLSSWHLIEILILTGFTCAIPLTRCRWNRKSSAAGSASRATSVEELTQTKTEGNEAAVQAGASADQSLQEAPS